MVSHTRKIDFYSFSPMGDSNLVEVSPLIEGISLTIGDKTFSFDIDSAMDIADAILQMAGEVDKPNDHL